MPTLNIPRTRELLENFDFNKLFIEELNWSRPATRQAGALEHDGQTYSYRHIAELAGVVVLEVTGPDGVMPPAKTRDALQSALTKLYRENLLIFQDHPNEEEKKRRREEEKIADSAFSLLPSSLPTQSLWRWVKRDNNKTFPREHLYVRGQPGDLFISKISGMVFDISRFDAFGNVSLIAVSDALRHALDVEQVTKKFYREYAEQRLAFTDLIGGIPDERQRRWYASVLLNRLMFIYFLQRKFLVDGGEPDYLQKKLAFAKQEQGANRYYDWFLKPLFFQGFARPERERDAQTKQRLGTIPYLNGGLFLEHRIEEEFGDSITVPDAAFENLFGLFARYSWNLDDTPEGKPDEINPDVLGYIFEKYINQKEFGAYYTRPEITEYLCEHTIHQLILDKINAVPVLSQPGATRRYDTLPELLLDLNADNCRRLLYEVLPKLSLLDPACGSGAFLVAAMKTLVNIYSAVTGRIEYLSDLSLNRWLADTRKDHRSLNYHIKRKIITENLYGVDIMEEAADIARLRLFLALVSSVKPGAVEELEPLPNIDFNVLAGNSLVGLLHVNPAKFNERFSFAEKPYAELVAEKNRNIEHYRSLSEKKEFRSDLQNLRDGIQKKIADANDTLDELLLEEFLNLSIRYEEAHWDADKGKEGKPTRRALTLADIKALAPFHWGYQFDEVLARGGFDAIIANPPWEIFKPQAKEFLTEYADGITKNKMTIKEFEERQTEALKDARTRTEWEAYLSRFPYVSAYYRSAEQYKNQISVVNGKKAGTDINLYKLFLEQCYNLLRQGGQCGIIVPSGIYTDLGTKQLRELLFSACDLRRLFGMSNEKYIFEGVHHAQRLCLLVFGKGGETKNFVSAFRINPREAVAPEKLRDFLRAKEQHLCVDVELVRRLSPDSLSIMEFKGDTDVLIAEKMLKFPLLGEKRTDTWNLALTREFDMTNDSRLFRTSPTLGRLPLYEGKMIWQFSHELSNPRYWIDEAEGRKGLLGRNEDVEQSLTYQKWRLGFRDVAASTNERTMIATILPQCVFTGNTLITSTSPADALQLLAIVGMLNSFVVDSFIRKKVTSHCNMFIVYTLPVPRLTEKDAAFAPIVERAARLICTTPEFEDLARSVALTPKAVEEWRSGGVEEKGRRGKEEALLASVPQLFAPEQPSLGDAFAAAPDPVPSAPRNPTPLYGATEFAERARLRAELDGLIAHLYGLTEAEFAHILSTFPLVPEPVKVAAQNAYRDVSLGLIR